MIGTKLLFRLSLENKEERASSELTDTYLL